MVARIAKAGVAMVRNVDWARTVLYAVPPGLMALEVGWTGYAVTAIAMVLVRRQLDAVVLRRPVARR